MQNHKFSKIIYLLLIIVNFIATSSQAQDFRLGFKAHPVFSNVSPSSDNHDNVGGKIGLSYGLLLDYYFKENYAFSTEFAISQLGGQVEYTKSDTSITSDWNMRYIEIPLTIKLLTDEVSDGLKVYGKFGLNLAFRIKSEVDVNYKKGGTTYANDEIKNANNYTQPLNTSLHLGTGVEMNLAKNLDLQIGLTYSSGFLNVMKSKSIYRLETLNPLKAFDANINYFALNVGLLF
jgi:opacity protein-like surface antigen